MKVKLSKSQWEEVGRTAGWLNKKAGGWGRFSEELSDIIEAQVMIGVQNKKGIQKIFTDIKNNPKLLKIMNSEEMSDSELIEMISDNIMLMAAVKSQK